MGYSRRVLSAGSFAWLLCTSTAVRLPAQTAPTLQVRSRLVVLDVAVSDAAGQPVRNLTRQDFRVLEDRQPQTIRSFEAIAGRDSVGSSTAAEPIVHSSADLDRIGSAPITILVLDEMNVAFADEVYARERLLRWLRSQPPVLRQPTLLAAINYKNFRVLADTTQDRDALVNAVAHHSADVAWRSGNIGTIGGAASDALAATLGALEQIAQCLRGLPGRKNLFWIGEGFPSVLPTDLGAGSAVPVYAELRHVDELLFQARVTLSIMGATVHPPNHPTNIETLSQSLTGPQADFATVLPDGSIAMANLAAPTGGVAFSGRNDIDNEIEQAEIAGDSYYTLSYMPSNTSDDPKKYRKISVEVLRPGLHVQTRDGYYPSLGAEPAVPASPSRQQLAFDLYGAANSQLPYTDLHVAAKSDAGQWVVTVRATDLGWAQDASGRLTTEEVILAACFSKDGKLLSRTFHILGADTAGTEVQLLGRQIPFSFSLQSPPGTARIRFVVRDKANGRVGAADATP